MDKIRDIRQLDLSESYSYADYLLWQLHERVELIRGKIFRMSPAPGEQHQRISMKLIQGLSALLSKNPCNIYHAPFDVRLPRRVDMADKETLTVVQPDIVVICDSSKIDEKGCRGAPDVVFEILSKSTLKKDLHDKYELYESSGIKEYWIIDPSALTIQINVLGTEGKYVPGRLLTQGDSARSSVVEGMVIDLDSLFPLIVEEPEVEYDRL